MAARDRNHPAHPRMIEAARKRRECVRLRLQHMTLSEIGKRVGMHKASVLRAIAKEMEIEREEATGERETLRAMEALRLDKLSEVLWPEAIGGDRSAIDRLLKIQAQRAALLGLNAPTRREVSGPDGAAIPLDIDLSQLTSEQVDAIAAGDFSAITRAAVAAAGESGAREEEAGAEEGDDLRVHDSGVTASDPDDVA